MLIQPKVISNGKCYSLTLAEQNIQTVIDNSGNYQMKFTFDGNYLSATVCIF